MTPAASSGFDKNAAQYDAHADVQREVAAWLAEWLPITCDGPALELGAGTGIFTRHLAPLATNLEATDAAPRMVRIGAAAFPGVTWNVADAAAPPAGGPYRWIFSCSLAQWLPDPERAFCAWRRAAAPGSRLISGWFIRGTLGEFFQICPEASPFAWRSTEAWLQFLEQSGWRVIRQETRRLTRQHSNAAAMLRAMHNLGAVIPRRLGTARLRQALRTCDQTHRNENGVTSTFAFLRVEAEAGESP